MYFCELEIAVIAKNDGGEIEKSARAARVPEDCGVSVTRFDSPDAFFAAKHLPDCTVIADGTQTGFDPQDKRLPDVVCALLIEATEINEVEEYAFKFEELFVMQCGDRYNDNLLGYYLERLVFRMKALSDSRLTTLYGSRILRAHTFLSITAFVRSRARPNSRYINAVIIISGIFPLRNTKRASMSALNRRIS